MIIQFQLPCYMQRGHPPYQAAQSHIQPDLECIWGWGIQCVGKAAVRNFWGLFSYSMKVYVRNKAGGDDSHVIDNTHNKFNSPRIYYLPASPALSLLIHFYQESFSHANEDL